MRHHPHLDSGYAWIVAIANCWVNFSIYGLFRSYGVLFLAYTQQSPNPINHEMASWPFTLFCSVYHLIGPIVGILSTRYSIRSLQLVGCLIASFGVLSAYFATNFFQVILLVGLVQGIGLGVIRTLSNVVIQQYFTKNRATATGIGMAGGTISSFIFPKFSEFIIENYGLKLIYVVFGAVMLQAMIGIVLQREPRWTDNRDNNLDHVQNRSIVTVSESLLVVLEDDEEEDNNLDYDQNRNQEQDYNRAEERDYNQDKDQDNNLQETAVRKQSVMSMKYITEKAKNLPIQNIILIMKQPIFYVITLTFITYSICLQVYLMTIVEVTVKNDNIDKNQAIFVITIFSIADLIGRLSFGWISDSGFAKPKTIAMVCNLSLCFFLILIPTVKTLFPIQLSSVAIGLLLGVITILWPLLNADYFGTDQLPLTLGLNCFFSGIESIIRPFIIGYFLDYLKRYDLLYYTVSGTVFFTAFLWLIEPLIHKTRERTRS